MSLTILSPKVDFVFKKIFGSEENKSVLISFLNAVLNDEENKIKSVDLNNTDIEKNFTRDKFSRLDIKATTDRQEIVNIEIQLRNQYNMTKRTLYYWSKIYESQISESDSYYKLNKTICINILDFKHLKNTDKFHNVFRLKNIETNEELTDICEIHFIEIPKLKKLKVDEKNEMLEIWTEFLRNPESEVIRNLEFVDKEIKKAKDKLCVMSQSDREREIYFSRASAMQDEISAIDFAKRQAMKEGIQQGIEQGIEKGMQQGIEQGIQQGIEQGIQQGIEKGEEKKAKEIAINLIKKGLDEETIALLTNLDLDLIKELKEKL